MGYFIPTGGGNPMTIAFDIDDTITRHTAFFALVSQALVAAGHRVVIITFREDRASTETALHEWGIAYDTLCCWWAANGDMAEANAWKAAQCRRYEVDVFFEDDPDVLAHVDESIVCFMPFGSIGRAEKWSLKQAG